jgi:hypothetical protein
MFESDAKQISNRIFSFHLKTCILLLGSLILSLIPNGIRAEAFSWENKDGTLIYGSHPPPDAINIKPLVTRGISRYSHEKAISGARKICLDGYCVYNDNNSFTHTSSDQILMDQYEKFREVNSILGSP